MLGFLGDEFFLVGFLFGWFFAWFFFRFFVFYWAEGFAVFFDQDFDAAGNRDGNDCAWNAKHVDANGDGGEDGEGRELKAFALNLWRDDVGFNLEINNRVDNESEASTPNVEGEKECDEGATDK